MDKEQELDAVFGGDDDTSEDDNDYDPEAGPPPPGSDDSDGAAGSDDDVGDRGGVNAADEAVKAPKAKAAGRRLKRSRESGAGLPLAVGRFD